MNRRGKSISIALFIFLVACDLAKLVAAAPILDVVDGQLMGASGVEVEDGYYDVQFLDGTCIAEYDGCDEVSDFDFQDEARARAAGFALYQQVFLSGTSIYSTDTTKIFGINDTVASILIPYDLILAHGVLVKSLSPVSGVGPAAPLLVDDEDLAQMSKVFARFTPLYYRKMPEPGAILLMLTGLIGSYSMGRKFSKR